MVSRTLPRRCRPGGPRGRSGLAHEDTRLLRRAALVHDVGKVGISAGTWGRKGPLSEREWEAVRLHPYYTGRVFARSKQLEAGKRLDEDAVTAVLTAADEHSPGRGRPSSANLSRREIEVLRFLARGHTLQDTATHLHIAYKTVDRHVQNIHGKVGVNTRAGATLWAVEHGLT